MKKIILLIGLLVSFGFVKAATITWDGTGDGFSWGDASNWIGGVEPTSSDDVIIPQGSNVYIITTGEVAQSITINSGVLGIPPFTPQQSTLHISYASGPTGALTVSNGISMAGDYSNVLVTVGSLSCGSLDMDAGLSVRVELSQSMTVSGDIVNSGAATYNIYGTFNVGGAFPAGGGTIIGASSTVVYNGATAQSVLDLSYNNLTFSGGGNKTISASPSVSGTFAANTSTVEFNSTESIQDISSLGSAFYNVIISGSGTKQFTSAIDINGDLTITSSTLSLVQDLTVAGNFVNNSTFNGNLLKVTFDGATASVISGSSSTTFYRIALAKTGLATLSASTTVELEAEGTVFFDNATSSWTATNFVFNSTNDDDGSRIDAIPDGSTITGDLTYNRFINSGSRRWWTLGVPMSNVSVSEMQDDILVTGGFTDSSVIANSNDYASLITYNEADLGDFDDGYVQFPVAAASENFGKGVGYSAFIRDDTTLVVGTRTLDVTGTPYVGNQIFSLGYSTGGTDGDEGWNLISNPYASAVSWTTGWNKTDIQTEAYAWDGASWSAVSTIAPFQAFFVKGTSSSTALTITESAKVTDAFILSRPQSASDVLEISIKDETHMGLGDQSAFIEKTEVIFDPASLDIYEGELDASYLPRNMFNSIQGGSTLVDIKTGDNYGSWYMKNTLPLTVTQKIIPISIVYTDSEVYSLSFYKQNFTSDASLYLRDNYTNTTVEVNGGTKYDFITDANVLSKSGDRFELLASTTPLSQEDEYSTLLNVYPVPASDQLYIRGLAKAMQANVLTTDGIEVMSSFVDQDNNMLDISTLSQGVYILNLVNGNETITEIIIVE